MLDRFKYKNKVRYHFLEKKMSISSPHNVFVKNILRDSFKRSNKWRRNLILKKKTIKGSIYGSCARRFSFSKINKNWIYNSRVFLKKKPFIGNAVDRHSFLTEIIDVIDRDDSLYFIKNNVFHFLDKNTGIYQNLNVLNFVWLFETKKFSKNQEKLENSFSMALKFFFNGFIFQGFKRICERRFLELLSRLKIFLKNRGSSGFQLLLFFFEKLRPLLGFRRKRLGRVKQKKKDVRYHYKLYHHNLRWQSLILKKLIFNSPFYIKRTKFVTVSDMLKGLIGVLENKGPITKGLISYYKLIGKRTPYAKRKKKKKEKEELLGNLKFLSFYLKANTASVSPPLSSVLGNLGLNTMNFCKEFNKLTEELPTYFLLKVYLKVDLSSRSWVLKLGKVPVTYIFRLISKKKKKKFYGSGGFFFKEIYYITLLDFFLVLFFFNNNINPVEIKSNFSILKSMEIYLITG